MDRMNANERYAWKRAAICVRSDAYRDRISVCVPIGTQIEAARRQLHSRVGIAHRMRPSAVAAVGIAILIVAFPLAKVDFHTFP